MSGWPPTPPPVNFDGEIATGVRFDGPTGRRELATVLAPDGGTPAARAVIAAWWDSAVIYQVYPNSFARAAGLELA